MIVLATRSGIVGPWDATAAERIQLGLPELSEIELPPGIRCEQCGGLVPDEWVIEWPEGHKRDVEQCTICKAKDRHNWIGVDWAMQIGMPRPDFAREYQTLPLPERPIGNLERRVDSRALNGLLYALESRFFPPEPKFDKSLLPDWFWKLPYVVADTPQPNYRRRANHAREGWPLPYAVPLGKTAFAHESTRVITSAAQYAHDNTTRQQLKDAEVLMRRQTVPKAIRLAKLRAYVFAKTGKVQRDSP